MVVLGIDPGASGGFAWAYYKTVEPRKRIKKIYSIKIPQSDSEIIDQLNYLSDLSFPDTPVCCLEKVSGFIGKPQPGSAMFKFGRNFGFLLGVLMVLKFEIHLVSPQKWQKGLSLGKKGERSQTEWKRFLKDEAQRLFPDQRVTLATSDALLILRFQLDKN
jgi:hypothetical protein